MSELKLSIRYARALFDFALEQKLEKIMMRDMEIVFKTCQESHELMQVLGSAIIKDTRKISIIDEIFATHIDAISLRYLSIIIKAKRASYIKGIAEQFVVMFKNHSNIKKAEIITAEPLDPSAREKIFALLEKQMASKIELEERVDEKLIGGFVLNVGDKQYDSSLLSSIERLKKEFKHNFYIKEI